MENSQLLIYTDRFQAEILQSFKIRGTMVVFYYFCINVWFTLYSNFPSHNNELLPFSFFVDFKNKLHKNFQITESFRTFVFHRTLNYNFGGLSTEWDSNQRCIPSFGYCWSGIYFHHSFTFIHKVFVHSFKANKIIQAQ